MAIDLYWKCINESCDLYGEEMYGEREDHCPVCGNWTNLVYAKKGGESMLKKGDRVRMIMLAPSGELYGVKLHDEGTILAVRRMHIWPYFIRWDAINPATGKNARFGVAEDFVEKV